MGGGLAADVAKSKAQGMGMGERGDRSEGGGDGESTAIKEDGNEVVGMGSRVLGLKAQTSPPEGAGRCEGVGVDVQRRWCGADAFMNWPRDESGKLTTSRRKENITCLTRAKG